MNIKICGLFLVLFAIYSFGFARRCYMYVDEKPFNENTTIVQCNPLIAEVGLGQYKRFYNVTNNATSNNYDCFVMEYTKDKSTYGGCIYSGVHYCDFPLRNPDNNFTCRQCEKDECNGGAFGISPSYFVLILAGTAATVLSTRLV